MYTELVNVKSRTAMNGIRSLYQAIDKIDAEIDQLESNLSEHQRERRNHYFQKMEAIESDDEDNNPSCSADYVLDPFEMVTMPVSSQGRAKCPGEKLRKAISSIETLLQKIDIVKPRSEQREKMTVSPRCPERSSVELRSNVSTSRCSTPESDSGISLNDTVVFIDDSRRCQIVSNRIVTRVRGFCNIVAQLLPLVDNGSLLHYDFEASKRHMEADIAEFTDVLEKLTESERSLQNTVNAQAMRKAATRRDDLHITALKLRIEGLEVIIKEQDNQLKYYQYAYDKELREAKAKIEELTEKYEHDLASAKEMWSDYEQTIEKCNDTINKLKKETASFRAREVKYSQQEKMIEKLVKQCEALNLKSLTSEYPEKDTEKLLTAKVHRLTRIADDAKDNYREMSTYVENIVNALTGRMKYENIQCPALVSSENHDMLMKFIANTSKDAIDKLAAADKALSQLVTRLESSKPSFNELKMSVGDAQLLVQLIKKYKSENVNPKHGAMFEVILDLSQSTCNSIMQLSKFLGE